MSVSASAWTLTDYTIGGNPSVEGIFDAQLIFPLSNNSINFFEFLIAGGWKYSTVYGTILHSPTCWHGYAGSLAPQDVIIHNVGDMYETTGYSTEGATMVVGPVRQHAYLIGGTNGSLAPINSIRHYTLGLEAEVSALGSQVLLGTSFPVNIKNAAGLFVEGVWKYFIAGGSNTTNDSIGSADIYAATCDENTGVLTSAFSVVSTLPKACHKLSMCVVGPRLGRGWDSSSRLYVFGYYTEDSEERKGIFSCPFNSGSLGAWRTDYYSASSHVENIHVGNVHPTMVFDPALGDKYLLIFPGEGSIWAWRVDGSNNLSDYRLVSSTEAIAGKGHTPLVIDTTGTVNSPTVFFVGGTDDSLSTTYNTVYYTTITFNERIEFESPISYINAIAFSGQTLGHGDVGFDSPKSVVSIKTAISSGFTSPMTEMAVIGIQGVKGDIIFASPPVTIAVEASYYRLVTAGIDFEAPITNFIAAAVQGSNVNVSFVSPVSSFDISSLKGVVVEVQYSSPGSVFELSAEYTPPTNTLSYGMTLSEGTICVNALNRAASQFSNFVFTSYANFNGAILATGKSEGLFIIAAGDQDNGDDIDAHFVLPSTDAGLSNPKRLRSMFFGYSSADDLEVAMSFDERATSPFTVSAGKTGLQRSRVVVSKNHRGRYLSSTKVSNTNGCDFHVDSISANLILLHNARA